MTILEMHEKFRTLGQQNGLQLVRGILPETIDSYINDAINHVVREILNANVSANFGNVVVIQKNQIGIINGLRTLYVQEDISVSGGNNENEGEITDIEPFVYESLLTNSVFGLINVDIIYNDGSYIVPSRFIEPNNIQVTLSDYLSRASKRHPIVTITEANDIDKLYKWNIYTDKHSSEITKLRIGYIKYPATVKLDDEDDEASINNINCDLPIHLHNLVIEEAVRLWFQSLGLTSNQTNQTNNKE